MSDSIAEFNPAFQWAVTQAMAECGHATVGSGFRTMEEQKALLHKRAQGILVADPGTSRHEGNHYGAVDMEGDLECFARAGAKYGLTNADVPGEPWHFQFTKEAEQAVADGTYADQYGMAQTDQGDSLDAIRQIVFGGAENPAQPDVPQRVKEGLTAPGVKQMAKAPLYEGEKGPLSEAASKGEKGPLSTASKGGADSALSDVEAARYFAQAGFTGDALVTMLATAIGESGLNPLAAGDQSLADGTWGPSLGLAQIRSLKDQSGTGGWRDAAQLTDPLFNARAAYAISNGGTNFTPWTIYKNGSYQGNLDRARAAAAALGADGVGPASAAVGGGASAEDDDMTPIMDLIDPVGTAQEIADMMLRQPKTDPVSRLQGGMADA